MSHCLRTVLGMSALCLGLALGAANASESRTSNFLFACDGTNKTVSFVASSLGNNVTRFIQGTEISLFENHGGLQYIVLRGPNPNRQLLTLGIGENRASDQYQGFIPVTTSAGGSVSFTIDGACNPGSGQIQGNVTVWFF